MVAQPSDYVACDSIVSHWMASGSHCVQIFIAYFGAPYTKSPLRFQGFLWVFMSLHGFLEVGITSNLGGPVGWLVGWVRFQEVITFKT